MSDRLFDDDPLQHRDPTASNAPARFVSRDPRTLAHTSDPETSKEAAAGDPGGKESNRFDCLLAHGRAPQGLIDDEVSESTGLELVEARRRCTDLRNAGLLQWKWSIEAGYETRLTAHRRRARVSELTAAGREAIR